MARPKCASTGKTKFPSRLEADLALADTHRSNSHHRHRKFREEPSRSYRCGHCGGWHHTSDTRNQNRSTA